MIFPYQCLAARSRSHTGSNDWILFGASGPMLVTQSSTGATSIWPQQDNQSKIDQGDGLQERPGKRVKLSLPQDRKSNFTHLILSESGSHLVAVTGEDKCIHVFQIDAEGHIQQLSERCMPRRPSSVAIVSGDSTILCADKFGDVYALPLLPSPEEAPPEISSTETPEKEKDFAPAASVLTVHSGRNRRTLEEQLKQKAKAAPKTKETATFKHDLLLGHVSMLTDLTYAKVENRGYIITADRDEHIRISRGPPQAHIIEGFCFGHEQFVSRLCLAKGGSLVSGGGDTDLFVWDWQKYQLLEKLPLQNTVIQYLQNHPNLSSVVRDESGFRIAVSGIWQVPNEHDKPERIIAACEGVPALFAFDLNIGATSGTAIPLNGNALSVAFVNQSAESCVAIVSVDSIHQSGSTSEFRDDNTTKRLQFLSSNADGSWHEDASLTGHLQWFASQGAEVSVGRVDGVHATSDQAEASERDLAGTADDKATIDILYTVENLRKRPGAEE